MLGVRLDLPGGFTNNNWLGPDLSWVQLGGIGVAVRGRDLTAELTVDLCDPVLELTTYNLRVGTALALTAARPQGWRFTAPIMGSATILTFRHNSDSDFDAVAVAANGGLAAEWWGRTIAIELRALASIGPFKDTGGSSIYWVGGISLSTAVFWQ